MCELPHALRPPLSRNVALLLESRIPARLAWVGPSGRPRVVAIWFVWTGRVFAMSAFSDSAKLRELHDGVSVSITIDTDTFPYRSIRVAGQITVRPVEGLSDEYRTAAARYLGTHAGASWCRSLGERDQAVIELTPTRATVSDMSRSPFLADESSP